MKEKKAIHKNMIHNKEIIQKELIDNENIKTVGKDLRIAKNYFIQFYKDFEKSLFESGEGIKNIPGMRSFLSSLNNLLAAFTRICIVLYKTNLWVLMFFIIIVIIAVTLGH